MPVSQSYIDGLTRQVFIRDYILNGMFPCQSDIVRAIRSKKRPWDFNDRFEYRMLMATTNTSGSLNSQIFKENVGLLKPNELTYNLFRASYGTVSDGFDVDMTVNLETQNSRAAFVADYAMRVHSMRVNVASSFKNFAINGRYGVLHRISPANVTSWGTANSVGVQNAPVAFTIDVPMNVFASGFKKGKYLIKTSPPAGTPDNSMFPWGNANVTELYVILDNQPRKLTLAPVLGSTSTTWTAGQFLEVAGNRAISRGPTGQPTGSYYWNPDGSWGGTGTYDAGGPSKIGDTGAMEGLADLFPWHLDQVAADGSYTGNRAGLDLPFREQNNRLTFSTEQAGGFYVRGPKESIIDAIMNGVALTAATVPYADVGVWMNPETRLAIGYQETDNLRVVKDIALAQPIIFQRGVTATSYTVGSKVIPDVISDYNLPTNIVVIGPKEDLAYNAWDNSMFKIDEFIHEQWSSSEPPKPEDLTVPNDFVSKLDLSSRITYGAPILTDGNRGVGGFIHPSNRLPIAFHEMGALFTESPFAYTIVNLRREILKPSDAGDATIWVD